MRRILLVLPLLAVACAAEPVEPPTALEVAAALKADPAFLASVRGEAGPAASAEAVAAALKSDVEFLEAARGPAGAQGEAGPAGEPRVTVDGLSGGRITGDVVVAGALVQGADRLWNYTDYEISLAGRPVTFVQPDGLGTGRITKDGVEAGYRAARAWCQERLGSPYAHMCTLHEMQLALQMPRTGAGVSTSGWVAGLGGYDCEGYTSEAEATYGLFADGTTVQVTPCWLLGEGFTREIACCL